MRPFASANTMLPVLFALACAGGPAADSTGANNTPPATPTVAAATTEPSPPTCDDWRNRDFFSSASMELVRECLQGGVDPRAPVGYAPVIFSAARTAADPDIIAILTDAGADPNVHLGRGGRGDYRRGYTPLHTAAAYNPTPGIVTALVAAGADLDARDDEGGTPVHAAWTNRRAIVDELLQSGADPLARDERGRVADPTSCANWNTPAFSRLALVGEFELCLGLGEDVNTRDTDGNTPLHLAAQAENPSAVTFLLEAGGDVSARNNTGATPLHRAVDNEGAEVVTALLEAGADINDGASRHGTPLLHSLARTTRWGWSSRWETSEAVINALLEAGADVNAPDSAAKTPLLASFELRRREGSLADLPLRLLALGADASARDSQGRTALHVAAAAEGPEVVRALLQAGADPQALDADGASTLHAAAATGMPEVIELLISAGANPGGRDSDSRTPLHLAVQPPTGSSARAEVVPWTLRAFALLDAGADPNARTGDGDTPLHLHVSGSPDTDLMSGLVRAGADLNARNDSGETPLRLARARNSFPLARKLIELGADPENDVRVVDPGCSWEPRGRALYGASFLANAPAASVRGCLESGTPVDARDEEGATHLARMVSTLACCVDFANVFREFVAAGADVNARDDEGKTVLHRALTMSGRVPGRVLNDVTAALLDAGADPNARDSKGSSLLHTAAEWGGLSREVSLLVAAGADVNERNSVGETPLHLALRHDNAPKIQALLQLGADPSARDGADNTADPVECRNWGSRSFFALAGADVVAGCIASGADASTAGVLANAAAWTRDPAVVSLLLEAGADARAIDDFYGFTPLHQAAQSGTAEVVRTLLEAGADANAWATGYNIDYGWNWTPLHLASKSNPDPDVVAALVDAGADLGALGGAGFAAPAHSPLHYAGANPNPAVAAALLDAGADVNALSPSGRTPLHEAAANATNPAVIELLVASGADVNARDTSGYTPMHSAAWYNRHPEVMTALIAAGADLNARDPDGYVSPSGGTANHRTPLLMAMYRGGGYIGGGPTYTKFNASVVEVLVRAGADLTLTDDSGRTALHVAARWHPAVFPLLLRLGADPDVRDADGSTPLDYALGNRSLQGLPEVRRTREALWRGQARR